MLLSTPEVSCICQWMCGCDTDIFTLVSFALACQHIIRSPSFLPSPPNFRQDTFSESSVVSRSAEKEERDEEDGIVWSAVIFAHTMATSPEGVNAAAAPPEEKKGIRFRIPKFFPNRAEHWREKEATRRKKCI